MATGMTAARERFGLAVAQMGPVHLADSRAAVVQRLLDMLREAASRGARLVVFPELALTTFFPRYWMDELEATARFFEPTMPSAETQPLFDLCRAGGVCPGAPAALCALRFQTFAKRAT